jgi:hypothetical protein
MSFFSEPRCAGLLVLSSCPLDALHRPVTRLRLLTFLFSRPLGAGPWARVGSLLLAAGLLAGGVTTAQGQGFGRIQEMRENSNVAYFYHAQPGEATVQVSVWGTIPATGIYEVPDSTDLDKLLTMAGGIPIGTRQEGQKAQRFTVRVYRPSADGGSATARPDKARTLLFEARVDSMLTGQTTYPLLRDDDVVVVEAVQPRPPFTWRDVISIVSSAGTLVLLGLRIFERTAGR